MSIVKSNPQFWFSRFVHATPCPQFINFLLQWYSINNFKSFIIYFRPRPSDESCVLVLFVPTIPTFCSIVFCYLKYRSNWFTAYQQPSKVFVFKRMTPRAIYIYVGKTCCFESLTAIYLATTHPMQRFEDSPKSRHSERAFQKVKPLIMVNLVVSFYISQIFNFQNSKSWHRR